MRKNYFQKTCSTADLLKDVYKRQVKELAFIYLVVFVLMYIAGPGKFSIDHFIGNKLAHNKRK